MAQRTRSARDFYAKPAEPESGKGFGSTEAARGALSDWIVPENGKIANYQVITPTAWNIGPRDGNDVLGRWRRPSSVPPSPTGLPR